MLVSVGMRPVEGQFLIPARGRWRYDEQRQASVFTPSIFIAQLPQIPSRQLLLKVRVGSSSFLILINASSIIGPVLLRSNVYVCMNGLELGSSGFHRYTWKVFILAAPPSAVSLIGVDFDAGSGPRPGFGSSVAEANDLVHIAGATISSA